MIDSCKPQVNEAHPKVNNVSKVSLKVCPNNFLDAKKHSKPALNSEPMMIRILEDEKYCLYE
jgi:hypothetical protein